jgi:Cft2 family RNA processing exonuclease
MPRDSSKKKQKVTISVDSETYQKYRDYCEEHAFMLSKKIELFMKKELEENAKSKKK